MAILITAKKHFDENIARANALSINASSSVKCEDDMLRSALMFAVGACDAYFADAYADLISRVLRAKDSEPSVILPYRINELKIPVTAILRPVVSRDWRWRMAARELMEKENVLSLERIRHLFNQFYPVGPRFYIETV